MEISPSLDYDQALFAMSSDDKGILLHTLNIMANQGAVGAAIHGYADLAGSLLMHRDPDVVAAAATTLAAMGSSAYAGTIAESLRSRESRIRYASLQALGCFEPKISFPYVQDIVPLLDDQDEAVRVVAIQTIGLLGAEAEGARLSLFLNDPSAPVVAAACQALGALRVQEKVADIASKLDDERTRYAAVSALASLGARSVEGYAEKIITTCLSDKDVPTRQTASKLVGDMAEVVAVQQSCIAELLKLLTGAEAYSRCGAALAIGFMGDRGQQWVRDVLSLMDDDSEDVSWRSLQMGGGAPRPPAALRKPVCAAITAMGLMRASSRADTVASRLTDVDWEVRVVACEALAAMGGEARIYGPEIGILLDDDVHFVRSKAAVALAMLKVADEAEHLSEVLVDKSPSVRASAIFALGELGEDGCRFAHEVAKMVGDTIVGVRVAAVRALGRLGVGHYAGIVATTLNDPLVRSDALEALGLLGAYGAAFAEDVAECLQDDDTRVRVAAVKCLKNMGQQASEFAHFLLEDAVDDKQDGMGAAKSAFLSINALDAFEVEE